MILWDPLLQAGMEGTRGQKGLIVWVKGDEKGNRLFSRPALCRLLVAAVGLDGGPAYEWDVGGFA